MTRLLYGDLVNGWKTVLRSPAGWALSLSNNKLFTHAFIQGQGAGIPRPARPVRPCAQRACDHPTCRSQPNWFDPWHAVHAHATSLQAMSLDTHAPSVRRQSGERRIQSTAEAIYI